MIDYTYVECTSACVTALAAFQKRHPTHRAAEIRSAIARAAKFMESKQEDDGSWCVHVVLQSLTVALSGWNNPFLARRPFLERRTGRRGSSPQLEVDDLC
jgi:hypothetical protein